LRVQGFYSSVPSQTDPPPEGLPSSRRRGGRTVPRFELHHPKINETVTPKVNPCFSPTLFILLPPRLMKRALGITADYSLFQSRFKFFFLPHAPALINFKQPERKYVPFHQSPPQGPPFSLFPTIMCDGYLSPSFSARKRLQLD